MSEVSPARSSPVLLAAGMALVHATVAAPLLYELRVRVPEKVRVFGDYNMRLPAVTQPFADASSFVAGRAANLLVLAGLLVVDGIFLWFLLRDHPTLAWAWFLAVIVVLLLLAGGGEFATWLAQRQFEEVWLPMEPW
jgi:type II secretory pathway component PulF